MEDTSRSNSIPFHGPNTIIIAHARELTKGSLLWLLEGPDAAASFALGTVVWVAALAAPSLNEVSGMRLVGVVVSVAAADNPGRVGHTTIPYAVVKRLLSTAAPAAAVVSLRHGPGGGAVVPTATVVGAGGGAGGCVMQLAGSCWRLREFAAMLLS